MKKGDRVKVTLPTGLEFDAQLGNPAREDKTMWFCSAIEKTEEGEVLQTPQAVSSKYIESSSSKT